MSVFGFKDRRVPELLSRNAGRLNEILRTGGGVSTQFHNPTDNWLFLNDSGEAVPPFAVMRVTDVAQFAGRDVFSIVKPTSTAGRFAFNGRTEVAIGKAGICYVGPRVVGRYTGTISPGSTMGISGWDLSTGGSMLATIEAYGDIDGSTGVFQVGGGSDGSSWGFAVATLDQDVDESTAMNDISHAYPFAYGASVTGTVVKGYQGGPGDDDTIRLMNPARFYGAEDVPFVAIDSGVDSGSGGNYFVITSMACNELSESCGCGGSEITVV